jgi:hypothetical protein
MSTPKRNRSEVGRYMQAVTTSEKGRAGQPLEELIWLLGHATEMNEVRLRLLQSLQRGLSAQQTKSGVAASTVDDLREALTNVIIMQSRISEREETLLDDIKSARAQGLLDSAAPDLEDLRSGAGGIVSAYLHLGLIASGP